MGTSPLLGLLTLGPGPGYGPGTGRSVQFQTGASVQLTSGDDKDVTALLRRWRTGDKDAGEAVLALLYGELRGIAAQQFRRERPGHTLQPTALANEAYMRIVRGTPMEASDRTHFLALAARVVRQVLVDHGRGKGRRKRGGEMLRVTLSEIHSEEPDLATDVLDLDTALIRLGEANEDAARVVELKFFGGLTTEEIASEMGSSIATVVRKWKFARAWLYSELATPPTT